MTNLSLGTERRRRRFGKWAVRIVLLVIILSIPTAGVLWLCVHHIPAWYRPPIIAPQDYQQVRDDFESVFNEMSENLMSSKPFKLTLSDRQLNRWLAVRGEILPEATNWIPGQFDEPMIRFDRDSFTIAGTVSKGEIRSVVSLGWKLDVAPEIISIRLMDTHSGSLPVPELLISKALNRLSKSPELFGAGLGDKGMKLAGALKRAKNGIEVENRFRWKNGDRLFRIARMEGAPGSIRLSIEPLDENGG